MKIKDLNDLKVFAFKAAVAYSKIDINSDACKEIAAELGMKLDDLQQHSTGKYARFSLGSTDSLHLANFIGRLREKIIGVNTSESSEDTNLSMATFDFNVDAKKELDKVFAIFQFGCCFEGNIARMFMLLHAPTFIDMMNKIDPKLDSSSKEVELNKIELSKLAKYLEIEKIDTNPYTMDQVELKTAVNKARLKLHPDKESGNAEKFKEFDGLYKRWIANKPQDIQDLNLRKTGLEIQQLFYETYDQNVSSALGSFGTRFSDDFKYHSRIFVLSVSSNREMQKSTTNTDDLLTLDQSIKGHTSLLQKRIQYDRKNLFIISFINWSSLFAGAMLFNNSSSQGLLSATTSLSNKSSLCGFGAIMAAHLLGFGAQRFFEEKSEICRNLDHYLFGPPIAINFGILAFSIRKIMNNAVQNGAPIECHPGVKLVASSLACTAAFLYWQYNASNNQQTQDQLPPK
ncbi:MAG: hypothetical protein K0R73_306 [Candidatus Midichloriaceae bacterium]|nr:hypothetical protein [Candidatus Midichloriaceae bacterium]